MEVKYNDENHRLGNIDEAHGRTSLFFTVRDLGNWIGSKEQKEYPSLT